VFSWVVVRRALYRVRCDDSGQFTNETKRQ
jgi:hypothetical protein